MKRYADDLGLAVVLVLIVATIVFLMIPMGFAAVMSFDARTFLGPFPPSEFSWQWYARFFSDDYYLDGLKTSLVMALVATTISTAIGVTAALVIDHYEFPGKAALSAFFLSPLMVPPVVIGFALLMFFSLIGVFDGFYRLIGGHVIITAPYAIRTTLASLVGIRRSLTEAALSLGATERAAFWEITLPLAKTGIVAGALFAFAISMDDVAVSLFLTDPHNYTLPVALLSMMRSAFDLTIAAASVLLMLLTVALIFTLDRAVGLDRIIGQGIYRV